MKNYLCQEINLTYVPDENEDNRYSYIQYTFVNKVEYNHDDIHELVVNVSTKTLSTGNVKIGNIKSRSTVYKKINDDTTINTVSEKVNLELNPVDVDNMEYYYAFVLMGDYIDVETGICKDTGYKYVVIEFDLNSNKALVTYCLSQSNEKKTASVDYFINRNKEEVSVTINDIVFKKTEYRRIRTIITIEENEYRVEFYSGEGYNVDEIIKHT